MLHRLCRLRTRLSAVHGTCFYPLRILYKSLQKCKLIIYLSIYFVMRTFLTFIAIAFLGFALATGPAEVPETKDSAFELNVADCCFQATDLISQSIVLVNTVSVNEPMVSISDNLCCNQSFKNHLSIIGMDDNPRSMRFLKLPRERDSFSDVYNRFLVYSCISATGPPSAT